MVELKLWGNTQLIHLSTACCSAIGIGSRWMCGGRRWGLKSGIIDSRCWEETKKILFRRIILMFYLWTPFYFRTPDVLNVSVCYRKDEAFNITKKTKLIWLLRINLSKINFFKGHESNLFWQILQHWFYQILRISVFSASLSDLLQHFETYLTYEDDTVAIKITRWLSCRKEEAGFHFTTTF